MLLNEAILLMGDKINAPIPIPIKFGNIIGTVDNIIVTLEGDIIHFSDDMGQTFSKQLDVSNLGVFKYMHIFKDGEILLCDNQKVYYSHDWEQLHESTVLDVNGNPYIPSAVDNFSTNKKASRRQIIDGTEILCWGNYSITSGIQHNNINVWYTVDKGMTIKSCFKFGVSVPDNRTEPLQSRHVHNVDFNPSDETFWLQTGDEPTNRDSHWVKGKYDLLEDEWIWDVIGSGDNYKTSNMIFYNDYIYYSWDIAWGGVARVRYDEAHLPEKHEVVFNTPNDCNGIYMGERGDLVALQSMYGGTEQARVMYYSPDLVNFYRIVGDVPDYLEHHQARYFKAWRVNNEGKLLAGVYLSSVTPLSDWDGLPSVWVDDIIKNAGFPNAFKPLD